MKKAAIFFLGFMLTLSVGIFSLSTFSFGKFRNSINDLSLTEAGLVSANGTETVAPSPYVIFEPLMIENIFNNEKKRQKAVGDVTILATGDIIPARVTNAKIKSKGVEYPFLKIGELLKSGDFTVANLESPLLKSCPTLLEGMTFCGTSDFATSMKQHGIGLVTLENNHIGNYGPLGVSETESVLESSDLPFARFDLPYVVSINEIKFGFLPVNGVGLAINKELLAQRINDLRKKTDVVIVAVHWGKEYTYNPSVAAGIAPDDPLVLGHFIIDSGADLVLGNHPHWVQGVEIYKEGFIAYSHGNFIFDQEWSQETKEGTVGSYTFNKGKLVDVKFIPVVIEDYAQPMIAGEEERSKILNAMRESSMRIRSNF